MPQAPPCYRWVFTLQTETEDHLPVHQWLSAYADKWTFQLESAPSTGKLHFQGRFSLKEKQRLTTLLDSWAPLTPHLEEEKATDSTRYCSKEQSRVAGPWSSHPLPITYQGKDLPKTLLPWQDSLVRYLLTTPDPREIVWFYDPEGHSGKSTVAKYMAFHHNSHFFGWSTAKNALNAVATARPATVYLFDLTRTKPEQFSTDDLYATLESIKNGMVRSSMYDSPYLLMDPPHVVVFSNTMPRVDALTGDRWNVLTIPSDQRPPQLNRKRFRL